MSASGSKPTFAVQDKSADFTFLEGPLYDQKEISLAPAAKIGFSPLLRCLGFNGEL